MKSKIILIALVGLCFVLAVCNCATADNANEKEYCIEFNFKDVSFQCPYWDIMHNGDGIKGYKICFKSNSTMTSRSDGLSGPMIGCDVKRCYGIVDFQFASAFATFQLDTEPLDGLINAPNVTTLSVQNRTYTYVTYVTNDSDFDNHGNSFQISMQNGELYTTIEGPLSLFVTTHKMSLEENIELFKSIRIVPISDKLYTRNFVLEPYQIAFNFNGMDDYKVVQSNGLNKMGEFESQDEQTISGWSGKAILELDRDSQSKIKLTIDKCSGRPDCIEASKDTAMKSHMVKSVISSIISKDLQINGVTWYSYQNKDDLERPIPRNNHEFQADLTRDEYATISFENVPDSIVEEFMGSFNITGLGIKNVEESYDHYVARVRTPSPTKPGISALEFIDKNYRQGLRYDANTGELSMLTVDGPTLTMSDAFVKSRVMYLAIRNGYYGPIPLPKNVSVTSPNGDALA